MGCAPVTLKRKALVECTRTIDLAVLRGAGALTMGRNISTHIRWSGMLEAEIGVSAFLKEAENPRLLIEYMVFLRDGPPLVVSQHLRLGVTFPHFGGRRWWIICPVTAKRVQKVHMLDARLGFASRAALDLMYQSQGVAKHMRAFDQLFRLQEKLGARGRLGETLSRPKGMWCRTFQNHSARHASLIAKCEAAAAAFQLQKINPGSARQKDRKGH